MEIFPRGLGSPRHIESAHRIKLLPPPQRKTSGADDKIRPATSTSDDSDVNLLVLENGVDEQISDDEFQTVATVGMIPEGEGRAFPVNGRMIAVFLRDGQYFAINDCCPHMGASLASGYVDGTDVVCPWHAWKFCIKDGLWMDNPKSKVRTEAFAVRVVDDKIQVSMRAIPTT